MIKGAKWGLITGVVVCVLAFVIASMCFPYGLTGALSPAYCSDPLKSLLTVLTFPVSYFTNDLASVSFYSLYTLVLYTILGAFLGIVFRRRN